MSLQRSRRESLGVFGAVGFSALTGCGGGDDTDAKGGAGGSASGGLGAAGKQSSGGPGDAQGGGTATAGGSESMAGRGAAGSSGGDAAGSADGAEGGAVGTSGAPGEGGTGGDAAAQCKANQESTVGPFPDVSPLHRADVRSNTSGDTSPRPGAKLTLRVRVLDQDAFCAALAGAVVDIWQCDAAGLYAGYAAFNTLGQDFCRGYQTTNAQGFVEFVTIFPGSYVGRALHIHISVSSAPGTLTPNAQGQNVPNVFVAQLYFDANVAAEVFQAVPLYQQGAAITPNASDAFFGGGGNDLIVDVTAGGGGYIGNVTVGVRRSAVGL